MYRLFFSCFFLILFLQLSFSQERERERGGQPPPHRRASIHNRITAEQIQAERIAYFTEKIGLTSEEAQLFWPIYNEMDRKRSSLFEEKTSIFQTFTRDADKLTERQINELLNRLENINKQEGGLHSEFDAKFRRVLSPQKVMKLYVAETGFRNYLLQTMRERQR